MGGPVNRRMTHLKLNVIANTFGKVWSVALSLVLWRYTVGFIGIEAYGLVGVFVSFTAVIAFLDLGLSTTMTRELARLSAVPDSEQEAQDLVRTLERIYWGVGAAICIVFTLLAPYLAHHWIQARGVSQATVQQSLWIMGLVFAFQWPDSFYAGGLMGLQKQVLLNAIRVAVATVQGAGLFLILWRISPTIQAYFLWQMVVYGVQTCLLAWFLWRNMPRAPRPARFDIAAWNRCRQFNMGVTGITLLAVILTQLDNILLSRFLPLKQFGYYTLARNVSTFLAYPIAPIMAAVFPRLSQLTAPERRDELAALYHKSCQLVSLAAIPLCTMTALFARELLQFYFRKPDITANAAGVLSLLAIGTAFNSIMTPPIMLQLAFGWTRLSFIKNLISLIFFVPLLYWMVRQYGAIGAAIMWIAINGSYLLFEPILMHRRILQREASSWYLKDCGIPLAISLAIGLFARFALPDRLSPVLATAWIVGMGGIACLLTASLSSATRRMLPFFRPRIENRKAGIG